VRVAPEDRIPEPGGTFEDRVREMCLAGEGHRVEASLTLEGHVLELDGSFEARVAEVGSIAEGCLAEVDRALKCRLLERCAQYRFAAAVLPRHGHHLRDLLGSDGLSAAVDTPPGPQSL
jgi:hypothetical protein